MTRILVIVALAAGLALAGCPNSKTPERKKSKKAWKVDRSKKRTASKKKNSPKDPPVKTSHDKHQHAHGGHPHGASDHHHHTHPHPHLGGAGGHHHPY